MKGVILAGGLGMRLRPCTLITNKHLLPVYDKPMICYPLDTLIKAGIKDILIVSGREHLGHICEFLGSGKEFGANFTYKVQDEAGGIAEALGLAEDFANGEKIVVILGDNIFEENIKNSLEVFENQNSYKARIFLKLMDFESAKRFGIALTDGDRVSYVEEKPKTPKSGFAITGLYLFDSNVFKIIKNLKPSDRGELEITDTINEYVKKGLCTYEIIKGFWSDAGTFESLYKASKLIKERNEQTKN